MRHLFIILIAVISSGGLMAQTFGGTVMGRVTDELTGEPVPFAPVKLKTSVQTLGCLTDEKGEYAIKAIPSGTYNIEFGSLSHIAKVMQEVKVSTGSISYVNVSLELKTMGVFTVEQKAVWRDSVIQKGKYPTLVRLDAEQISCGATPRDIGSILAASVPKVYQQREGGGLNISGSREGASIYYIDGVKVIGTPQVPNRGIGEVIVYTGGIPAQYGDTTSGVVIINTKSY